MNKNDIAVIMAGGTGMHLKSGMPPVMAQVMGRPMISRVVSAVVSSGIDTIITIVPKGDTIIKECLSREFPQKEIHTVVQDTPLGTAHAVLQAGIYIKTAAENNGNVVILNGDTPFMDANTICAAYASHTNFNHSVTVITAMVTNPFGYGRIIRDDMRRFKGIVEEQDANSEIKKINEISSGTYWFKAQVLLDILHTIPPRANGHYNLVDGISAVIENKDKADTFFAPRSDIVLGANNRQQLMQLNEYAMKQALEYHLAAGVDIPFSDGVIIEPDVLIGMDTCILPNTIIKGKTTIGKNCTIGPNTVIENSVIEDNVRLNNVQCSHSLIKEGATVGPFVNIQPNSVIGCDITVGSFVEINNSQLDEPLTEYIP